MKRAVPMFPLVPADALPGRPPPPRFDDSKPRRCAEVVGEGPHGQAQLCGCALGEGLICQVCHEGDGSKDASATRCAAHCPSAAHFGLPLISEARGGWRDAMHVEVVYGEERPHGGLYYAEMLDTVGRWKVVRLSDGRLARGSGQSGEEARRELRERFARQFSEEDKTAPDAQPEAAIPAASGGSLDVSDPEAWAGMAPEQLAHLLAVPGPGESVADVARRRRLRAVVVAHLETWEPRWAELEAKGEGQSDWLLTYLQEARKLRDAELCALLAAIGGAR